MASIYWICSIGRGCSIYTLFKVLAHLLFTTLSDDYAYFTDKEIAHRLVNKLPKFPQLIVGRAKIKCSEIVGTTGHVCLGGVCLCIFI